MPDTNLNNIASSNIVYFYQAASAGGEDGCGCGIGVVPNRDDLQYIPTPQDLDVILIENGEGGGIDIAIYNNGAWMVKAMKGTKGDKGDTGDKGDRGDAGLPGADGATGAAGQNGLAPEHRWLGTELQFKNPDGSWATQVDLKGERGEDGNDGVDGAKGDTPDHQWTGTGLQFQNPDGSWGDLVNLKGEKGDAPAHEWTGTQLRFQNPDGSWGAYTNLKGEPGKGGGSEDCDCCHKFPYVVFGQYNQVIYDFKNDRNFTSATGVINSLMDYSTMGNKKLVYFTEMFDENDDLLKENTQYYVEFMLTTNPITGGHPLANGAEAKIWLGDGPNATYLFLNENTPLGLQQGVITASAGSNYTASTLWVDLVSEPAGTRGFRIDDIRLGTANCYPWEHVVPNGTLHLFKYPGNKLPHPQKNDIGKGFLTPTIFLDDATFNGENDWRVVGNWLGNYKEIEPLT